MPPTVECRDQGAFGQILSIHSRYVVPADLAIDRDSRSTELVELPITSTIRLIPGVRRIDIRTEVDNHAENHRLRVLFPTGFDSDHVIVDGHFDRLSRPMVSEKSGLTPGWAEQPAPTALQRAFTAVQQRGAGLMVSTRGLPEYELSSFPISVCPHGICEIE